MDKYNLKIAVLGNSKVINFINQVEEIKRLAVFPEIADVKTTTSYSSADVIIIDETILDEIDNILSIKASYSVVVLICKMQNIAEIAHKEKFFDIWLDDETSLFEYRIKQFLLRMRDVLDAELSAKQLDTLIDSVPDLIWYKDVIGAHIKVNNSFCKTVNKTKEQIKDRGHYYIWDLDYEEYQKGEFVCMETEEIVIKEQKTFLFDEKVKIGDELRQLKTYKSAIIGRRGETLGTVGLARDVTDIWNTHAEFKTLIDHLPFPMIILSNDLKLVSSNNNFDHIFGIQNTESFDLKKFSTNFFTIDISMEDTLEGIIECEMKKDDSSRFFSVEKSTIYDVFNQLHGFFYIFNDETMKNEYTRKLKQVSRTDELTNVNNRAGLRHYFETNFQNIIETKSHLAFVVLDIDFFKQYNDIYGHVKGDEILVIMGKILRELSQDDDVFVARYGGEEFILAVKNKTLDEAKHKVQQLINKLAEYKLEHKGSEVSNIITISIGMAYYSHITNATSISEIVKEADNMLYEAKKSGRNQMMLTVIEPSSDSSL